MISIIIPNLNSTLIDQTIAAIGQQKGVADEVELLIVGMDDPQLVPKAPWIRHIDTGTPTPPAKARNIGIQAAQGDLLCFTDADCVPEVDWLARLTAVFQTSTIHVAGGGVVFDENQYWTLVDNLGWFHAVLKSAPAGERDLLPSLNLCVRREVVEKVGLFDESYPYPAGEDSEWTTRMRRAGYTLHFVPNAIITHKPRRADIKAVWHHGVRYGRYSIKIHPDYTNYLKTPIFLKQWWLLLPLAPLMALYITMQIFIKHPQARRHWHTFPGIYMSKIAWCFGAVKGIVKK